MEIEIIKLDTNEIENFSDLVKVFKEVFEWENFSIPNKSHLQKTLNNVNFLALVAKQDKKIVGGLTAYILDSYETEKSSVYLYDLAVLSNLQRKGIGTLLIETLTNYCKKNGYKEVFVQAEKEDVHAINFYRKTSAGYEMNATHFTYSFESNKIDGVL